MIVDLHIHTTTSDGSFPPEEVVDLAVARNIPIISITDHDTAFSAFSAIEKARNKGCLLIPGVELSSNLFGHSLHILGYFVDETVSDLTDLIKEIRDHRNERNHAMIAKFHDHGIDIDIEELNAIAQGEILSRPHFAQYLIQKKIVPSAKEAFERYLATDRKCHVPRKKIPPSIMIDIINAAGGISVLAHPGLLGFKEKGKYEELITTLKGQGLQGLEVYCSTHNSTDASFFRAIAERQGLIITGGSDFHGMPKPHVTLGKFYGANRVFPEIKYILAQRGYSYESA
ncbi:MAG: PHP domain-containing protein [Candidatus Omnitrophica bacterium]|nr:PHP domain-containing protein [Candidatus Omnitrophota bacterium]